MQNKQNTSPLNPSQLGNWPSTENLRDFVVNSVECAYVLEALRIAAEGVADLQTIDHALTGHGGFFEGPFEKSEKCGLNETFIRLQRINQLWGDDPRFRVSPLAEAYRTSGYGIKQATAVQSPPEVDEIPPVWLSSRAARRAETLLLLKNLGAKIETGQSPSPQALTIVAPLGFDVTTVAVVERLDPARTIGLDTLLTDSDCHRRVLASNPVTRTDIKQAAHALFARDGKPVSFTNDSAGFISQRVWAQVINAASEICQQGRCRPTDIDAWVAESMGLPVGPLAIGNALGPTNVLEVLFNMQTVYADPCYRPSPWLRRRGAIGLSLLQENG